MRGFKNQWWPGSQGPTLSRYLGCLFLVRALCCSLASHVPHGRSHLRLLWFGFFFLEIGSWLSSAVLHSCWEKWSESGFGLWDFWRKPKVFVTHKWKTMLAKGTFTSSEWLCPVLLTPCSFFIPYAGGIAAKLMQLTVYLRTHYFTFFWAAPCYKVQGASLRIQ